MTSSLRSRLLAWLAVATWGGGLLSIIVFIVRVLFELSIDPALSGYSAYSIPVLAAAAVTAFLLGALVGGSAFGVIAVAVLIRRWWRVSQAGRAS